MYMHYDLMLPLLRIMQSHDVTYSLKEAYEERWSHLFEQLKAYL